MKITFIKKEGEVVAIIPHTHVTTEENVPIHERIVELIDKDTKIEQLTPDRHHDYIMYDKEEMYSFQNSLDLYIVDLLLTHHDIPKDKNTLMAYASMVEEVYFKDETHLSIGKIVDEVIKHYDTFKHLSRREVLYHIIDNL